jgi:hypothetical protein
MLAKRLQYFATYDFAKALETTKITAWQENWKK